MVLDTKAWEGLYMIKAGVIGLGAMGQHHVRVYRELGCELVGVADADIKRAQEIGAKYNTRCFGDHRKLLGHVDVVSIAVPTSAHKDVALEFLAAKTHCLVEKPIASTVEEAEEMIKAARDNDVKLMVGHIERFNPVILKLKELIEQGVLGKIMLISTRRVGPFQPRIRDVGIIIDSATHDIDATRFLTGKEPVAVYSKAGRFKHPSREDHALIMLDFGDSSASLEVNWFTPHKVRTLVATGSEGISYLDYIEQQLTLHNSYQESRIKIVKTEPLKTEITHFISCVNNNTKPLVDGQEGLNTLRIALKASEVVNDVQR
ncbi:MAG: Gfo/Idh/MocA family oxidoreductase [Dehalococcoidales bacterium]|nr:Gfo/Idh/MocA family oxidoreductase [Dehalococcoidales bacterium]